jgi:molybdopterin-guanine dinucleotide biosynthesis protein A
MGDTVATGGAILAGGKSGRMGRDKATMDAGGATMVERSLEALRPIASPIVVVSDTGDKFRLDGCCEIADRTPGLGPTGGIVTALQYLGRGLHLVVACDMPFLKTELLSLLLHLAEDGDDAVVPLLQGRPEPLCAAYRDTALPLFEQFLLNRQRAVHLALETLNTRYVDEDQLKRIDPELASFINVNTASDADRWLPDRKK